MLQISALSKSYGEQILFDNVSFAINPGEHIGLVGRNGHGKTTLFKIIAGLEQADSGELHFSKDYQIGYLSQHLKFEENTALEEACLGLRPEEAWATYRAEAVLQGLGFSKKEIENNPNSLSGGFQVRLNLAKLILSEPNLLLLDEPTNYLDIVSMRWLTSFLKNWPNELLLITHDHGFLDQVTTHTIGIHRKNVRKIEGNTTKFFTQLEQEEIIHEQSRLNQGKKIEEAQKFIDTFRAKASKAKAVQSRIKALERMDTLEKLDSARNLDFSFNYKPLPGKRVLEAEDLSFHYNEEQGNLFENLNFCLNPHDRVAIIGKNGKGKSTLLKLLAGEFKPSAGKITNSSNLSIAYFGQTNVDRLIANRTVEQELASVNPELTQTKVRSIAGHMMFEGDAALKQINVLSGGEKSRVLLGKLLLTPANLLILDEPSNHLDLYSTDALLNAIKEFPGAILIVTHSEMMLRDVANRLVIFDRGKAELFEGTYDDFLRRVGWEEEGKESSKNKSNSQTFSKKELRKIRAEINARRSEELSPLQKLSKQLEKEITELEGEVSTLTEQLIEATKDGFGEEGSKISKDLHLAKNQIEQNYNELDRLIKKIEEFEAKYKTELEKIS